jgi:hypothetical protein
VFINAGALTAAVLSLVFSGCGGSSSHKEAAASSGTIKYLGHAHDIVSDRLPVGSAFSIVGQRYLFMGHHYLELRVHFAKSARVKEDSSSWARGPDKIEWGTQKVCDVHPFVIVYGLLKASDDTAYRRVAGKLVALRKVSLPASLDTAGALFYGTSPHSVSGLVIHAHAGQSIVTGDPMVSLEAPEGVCRHGRRPATALERLPRLRHAIAQIAQCLRRHGFDVTNPSLTGPGPVFDTHDVDTKSAAYIAAKAACVKEVLPAWRAAFSRAKAGRWRSSDIPHVTAGSSPGRGRLGAHDFEAAEEGSQT